MSLASYQTYAVIDQRGYEGPAVPTHRGAKLPFSVSMYAGDMVDVWLDAHATFPTRIGNVRYVPPATARYLGRFPVGANSVAEGTIVIPGDLPSGFTNVVFSGVKQYYFNTQVPIDVEATPEP